MHDFNENGIKIKIIYSLSAVVYNMVITLKFHVVENINARFLNYH